MTKPKGIDPTQAREKVGAGKATLICAYEDDDRCSKILLDGATTLSRWQASEEDDRDREIIFFCDGPGCSMSARRADEFERLGFRRTRYIEGGVEAWKKAGFPLAAEVEPINPAGA